MKIIKNVRSSEQQEQVKRYGNETHVLLGERVVEVDNGNDTVSTQYEYDKVIVTYCMNYANVVESANEFYKEEIKKELLSSIVVATSSGKKFYGDPISRSDISDAIALSEETGVTTTLWKLAESVGDARIVEVTVDELREARTLSLQAKANIIGV